MRQNLTLHDGTILPEGCHIQMATYEVGIDPERVENADKFDGYRHYNKRKREGETNWHRGPPLSQSILIHSNSLTLFDG